MRSRVLILLTFLQVFRDLPRARHRWRFNDLLVLFSSNFRREVLKSWPIVAIYQLLRALLANLEQLIGSIRFREVNEAVDFHSEAWGCTRRLALTSPADHLGGLVLGVFMITTINVLPTGMWCIETFKLLSLLFIRLIIGIKGELLAVALWYLIAI